MPTESYICTSYIDKHIETSDTVPKQGKIDAFVKICHLYNKCSQIITEGNIG